MFDKELEISIEIIIKAIKVSLQIFKNENIHFLSKQDKSPVTVADFAVQAIISKYLNKRFPNDKIVGEENSSSLKKKCNRQIVSEVLKLVNGEFDESLDENKLYELINKGNYTGSKKGRFWVIDPIDGTKGFLRKKQFAICLAFISHGVIEVACLACPNFSNISLDNIYKDEIYVAKKNGGAFRININNPEIRNPIKVSNITNPNMAKICESVESKHSDHEFSKKLCRRLNITNDSIKIDSQCKYAIIANGYGEIYIRIPTDQTYREKIWDHAAGYLIVKEAGGMVTDLNGNDLDFSNGIHLTGSGILASNGKFHNKIIEIFNTTNS